jgi:hypothetical protein
MKLVMVGAALAAGLALGACSKNAADTTVTDTAVTSADTAGGAGMAPAAGASGTTASADTGVHADSHDDGIISQGSRDKESTGETIKDAGEDAAEAVGDAANAVAGKRH